MAPNITATYGNFKWSAQHIATASGAIQNTTLSQPYYIESYNENRTANVLNFSASRSNSIYGAGSTIRPVSRTCRFFIKF